MEEVELLAYPSSHSTSIATVGNLLMECFGQLSCVHLEMLRSLKSHQPLAPEMAQTVSRMSKELGLAREKSSF